MPKGKNVLDYISLFFLNEYEKNDKIIRKYFQELQTKNLFYEQILNMGEGNINVEFKLEIIEQIKTISLKKQTKKD